MGKVTVLTPSGYRPTLSARIDVLERWFTPERFRLAWNLAKFVKRLNGCDCPAADLISDLDYSTREVYRWINGDADPSRRAFIRIDEVFSGLIGEDWQTVVNSFFRGGEKNRESH